MLDSFFQISKRGSSFATELKAGLTTFFTMSYILFIQPALLSGSLLGIVTGMEIGALTTATCLVTGLGTMLMGLYARFPIGQAPGISENFFFITTIMPMAITLGFANSWQVALGVAFIAGFIFFLLTLFKLSEKVLILLSQSMRHALVAGIGLFVATLGFQNATLIIKNGSTGISLNTNLTSTPLMIFFFGLLVGAILRVRKVKGYILGAILASLGLAIIISTSTTHLPQFILPHTIFSLPPSLSPLFLKLDITGALHFKFWPVILILLIMHIFDATGVLFAIGEQIGLMKKDRLPNANKALLSNTIATMGGACFGMSTVTSYVESMTGVEQGGRTGLTSLTIGILFLVSLFFYPVIASVAAYPPITAPALVLVGIAMIQWITKINWRDYTEALPSFLVVLGIPFSFSIASGLGLGLICYPLIKLLSGRIKELHWFQFAIAIVFLCYFYFMK